MKRTLALNALLACGVVALALTVGDASLTRPFHGQEAPRADARPQRPSVDTASLARQETPTADLSLNVIQGGDFILPGDALGMRVMVTNLGPQAARNVTLTLSLTEAAAARAAGEGWACQATPAGAAEIECVTAEIAPHTTASITLDVQSEADSEADTLTALVVVASEVDDPDRFNNRLDVEVAFARQRADLAVRQASDKALVEPGEPFRLNLEVDNAGPDDAEGLSLLITLLPRVPLEVVSGGWDCQPLEQPEAAPSNVSLACARDRLAAGQTASIELALRADTGNVLENISSVVSLSSDSADLNGQNNSSSIQVGVIRERADLIVRQAFSAETVRPGDPFSLNLDVDNAGPDDAEGLSLLITMAPRLAMERLSGEGWACRALEPLGEGNRAEDVEGALVSDLLLECTRARLAAGQTAPIALDLLAETEAVSNVIASGVALFSRSFDPDPVNNGSTLNLPFIQAQADLALALTADSDTVPAGGTLNHTIQVDNLGPDAAENVLLVGALPKAAAFSALSAEGWDCQSAEEGSNLVVTCARARLESGQRASLVLEVRAPLQAAEPITLLASATSDTFDPDLTNDLGEVRTTVQTN